MVSILKSQSDLISSKILLRNNSKLAKDIFLKKTFKRLHQKNNYQMASYFKYFFLF